MGMKNLKNVKKKNCTFLAWWLPLSISTWPVANLKQRSSSQLASCKFEKWKWRPPSTNYPFQQIFFLVFTFCHFAHRPGLFLLLSLSQSSIWRYEKPTNGNASGNSLLFHHLGHPYWGLSFHVCHKLLAALVPIHDLIRALTYDQPTWRPSKQSWCRARWGWWPGRQELSHRSANLLSPP